MSVGTANDMRLWKIEHCLNFGNTYGNSIIYVNINIDGLYQLLECVFKHHTQEWMIDCQKDIYGAEKRLKLINEYIFAVLHFSRICQFNIKSTQIKQQAGNKYKDMLKVWSAVLAPLLKGHPYHLKFLKQSQTLS